MIQGESYPISFTITSNGTALTPSNVAGVKVKLGRVTAEYPDGDLTYASSKWSFPISQADSLAMGDEYIQAQVKIGTEIFSTKRKPYKLDPTIIREAFDD